MATQISQACERCWRRKQKCSRERPTCLQCRTASKKCVRRCLGSASNDSEAGGDTGIEALKSRVQALREQVRRRQQDTQVLGHTPATAAGRDGPRTHESHETMQDDVAYLSLSAMAERTDHRPFLTGSISFITLLDAATGVCGANPTLSADTNNHLSMQLAAFRESSQLHIDLDTTEMRVSLDLYIDRMRTSFPFMTSDEFSHHRDSVQGQCPEDEKLALVYLGTATGILLGPHYSYKELYATEMVSRAIQILATVFECSDQMSILRCLMALTIHSLYTSLGGSTWHLLGLSITRCISAGIHTTRISDPHSDSKANDQRSRALWTLYILDTYVSTVLDRPFCLNDDDIQITRPPSTPTHVAKSDVSDAIFRHMIEYAQILRSVRQDKEASIFTISINLLHWQETMPARQSAGEWHLASLMTRGLMELLKDPRFFTDQDRPAVLHQAMNEFDTYLCALEDKIAATSGAVPALEALHVFAIGVVFATQTSTLNNPAFVGNPGLRHISQTQARLFQTLNILTLMSARYAAVRGLREIIAELQRTLNRPDLYDRMNLRLLVRCSEIVISDEVKRLLYDEGIGAEPI